MRQSRWRQPFGILLILLLIAACGAGRKRRAVDRGAPRWIQIVYYLVAGIV